MIPMQTLLEYSFDAYICRGIWVKLMNGVKKLYRVSKCCLQVEYIYSFPCCLVSLFYDCHSKSELLNFMKCNSVCIMQALKPHGFGAKFVQMLDYAIKAHSFEVEFRGYPCVVISAVHKVVIRAWFSLNRMHASGSIKL